MGICFSLCEDTNHHHHHHNHHKKHHNNEYYYRSSQPNYKGYQNPPPYNPEIYQ